MWIIGCPARAAIVFGATSLDGAAAVRVVGQIVGRMNSVRPVDELIAELVSELDDTLARLDKLR